MDLILNELSFDHPAPDQYKAMESMSGLVATIRQAKTDGVNGSLRVDASFYSIHLAPQYTVPDWMNDRQVDRDERLFFKMQATKSPYLSDLPAQENIALGYECTYQQQKTLGGCVAYLLEAPLVSILSEPCWDTHQLQVTVTQLADGELLNEEVVLRHVSRPTHFDYHRTWINQKRTINITTGDELWSQRQNIYPALVFCESVENQIRQVNHGKPMLGPVMRCLSQLQDFCQTWSSSGFDASKISCRVSPESDQTLNRYFVERTFKCPDGVERLFSWHAKINFHAWRVHFFFDESKPGTLLIGYVGKHLPTINDPT